MYICHARKWIDFWFKYWISDTFRLAQMFPHLATSRIAKSALLEPTLLKTNSLPLKNGGWETILSFFVSAHFTGSMSVLGRVIAFDGAIILLSGASFPKHELQFLGMRACPTELTYFCKLSLPNLFVPRILQIYIHIIYIYSVVHAIYSESIGIFWFFHPNLPTEDFHKQTNRRSRPLEIGSGLLESVEVLRVLLRSPPFGDHSRERERERQAGPSRCMAPVISVCQMCPEKKTKIQSGYNLRKSENGIHCPLK